MTLKKSKFRLSLLLLFELISTLVATTTTNPKMENPWITGLRNLLEDCPTKTARVEKEQLTPSGKFVRTLADCARRRAAMAIDDILDDDVIPIVKGLDLVRYKTVDERYNRWSDRNVTFSLGKLLKHIHDQHLRQRQQLGHDDDAHRSRSWRENLTSRIARVLKTHVIKIDVERLEPAMPEMTTSATAARSGAARALADGIFEGRGPARRRRRRQMQMMPMIMMAVLLMGSVLIPMGFQFLAVLGGKALLLAKMALMLSSIQGLKKIATNGVNYGLYHSPVPEAWHERGSNVPYDVTYAGTSSGVVSAPAAGPSYHHANHHVSSGGYLDGGGASSYSLGNFRKRSAVSAAYL